MVLTYSFEDGKEDIAMSFKKCAFCLYSGVRIQKREKKEDEKRSDISGGGQHV